MQSYLCPSCGGTTEAGLHRVVWCGDCGQPLTAADLVPVAVSVRTEEPEPEPAPAP